MAQGYGQYANDASQDVGERGERGYRRRKLAAMAGNLYRTGQQAVTEFRDSYAQSRGRGLDDSGVDESTHIPSAFPDLAIASHGNEQLVLFPSYGKTHVKEDWAQAARNQAVSGDQTEDWWRQEWERHEDEKAVVDVDVRGWIYNPHTGPMTRRNRILIGLARQLSGVPAPRTDPVSSNTSTSGDSSAGERRTEYQIDQAIDEQKKIAKKAAVIEKRGQEEKRVAYAGGYSETPKGSNDSLGSVNGSITMPVRPVRSGSYTPDSTPGSPRLLARQPPGAGELSDAELIVANANLMARVAPFLTTPRTEMPITVFFYNDTESKSKTVLTDDAGHFNVRAALPFVPTQVRVLANEKLSATQDVEITHPAGISLISDIDDTIKRSNISGGAREIFRNTFVRDLGDLRIDGVREWYTDLHNIGVSVHYCSNSPWQLYPVLATFFKIAGLPPGSLHLKQYSGMLQGIFEPVAERKKTTLNRLIKDFPRRKFLLVGDSGEADLEVYTELALANPGNVLGIFIRDVTTPPDNTSGFFDPAFDFAARSKMSSMTLDDHAKKPGGSNSSNINNSNNSSSSRQSSAPRIISGAVTSQRQEKATRGPLMGTLIDLTDEPKQARLDEAAALAQVRQRTSSQGPGARKVAPPRPAKPAVLRSSPSLGNASATYKAKAEQKGPKGPGSSDVHTPNNTALPSKAVRKPAPTKQDPPPPPLPRRTSGLKSLSPRLFGRGSSNADVDFEPLPPPSLHRSPPSITGATYHRPAGASAPSGSPVLGAQAGGANKKVELWRRRLLRAQEQLHGQGVALYTWRRGDDVKMEAVGLVRSAQEGMRRR
ncbi:hypothetical protein E4U58_006331 [Claviceps cyperi]|nr:hypothetical protein E4U58_006331 [Claviceps cyperi]